MPQTQFDRLILENSNDTATLKNICHEGLLASFHARIKARPSEERLQWTLHKYIGFPRIVSTNIYPLEIESSALYQVVVKIRSLQTLERMPAKDLAGNARETKKMIEYLVLQRTMLKGKEGEWKIWGTAEESKVEEALGDDALVVGAAVSKQ